MIVSDNGTEFTSMAILRWSQQTGIEWHYIAPGKPQQNAFVESFNGRLRDELLNETPFSSFDHAPDCLPTGKKTTTPFAHTARSAICRRQLTQSSQRPTCNGTLRYVEGFAPRPVASPSHTGSNDQRALPIAG